MSSSHSYIWSLSYQRNLHRRRHKHQHSFRELASPRSPIAACHRSSRLKSRCGKVNVHRFCVVLWMMKCFPWFQRRLWTYEKNVKIGFGCLFWGVLLWVCERKESHASCLLTSPPVSQFAGEGQTRILEAVHFALHSGKMCTAPFCDTYTSICLCLCVMCDQPPHSLTHLSLLSSDLV